MHDNHDTRSARTDSGQEMPGDLSTSAESDGQPSEGPETKPEPAEGETPSAPDAPKPPTVRRDQDWTQPPSPFDPLGNMDLSTPDARDFKSARSLMTASNIMGPVSIFIGGVLLAGCGIGCAIASMRKFKRLSSSQDTTISMLSQRMAKAAMASVVICVIAFVVNAISAALLFPKLMDAMESGTLDSMLNAGMPSTGTPDASAPSDLWG